MENFLRFVESEWATVSDAPFTFILLVSIAYGASHLWHRERLRKLTEQKHLLDDDIRYLKEKTGSGDLKDVIARIEDVENELKELGNTDFAGVFTGSKSISDLPELP